MPLLKGKENVGHNIETEEASGKSKAQSVAIALHTADVPKARDIGMATAPGSGLPVGSRSHSDGWRGKVL